MLKKLFLQLPQVSTGYGQRGYLVISRHLSGVTSRKSQKAQARVKGDVNEHGADYDISHRENLNAVDNPKILITGKIIWKTELHNIITTILKYFMGPIVVTSYI